MNSADNANRSHSKPEFEAEITKIDSKFLTAFLQRDLDTLDKIFSPSFISLTLQGFPVPRAENLEAVKSGRLSASSIETLSFQVQQVDDNTGLALKHVIYRGIVFGKPFEGECWTTYVWSRAGGDWTLHSLQISDARLASAWRKAFDRSSR